MPAREWAETWIEYFNRRAAKEIFIPREKASGGMAADYVVFVETGVRQGESAHGESPIGRQGGMQKVMFHKSESPAPVQYTILHEMGHCVGLGHEQYNPKWIFREFLSEVHSSNYEKQLNLYRVFQNGDCDYDSIMMYSVAAFGITEERLRKIITITQHRLAYYLRASLGRNRPSGFSESSERRKLRRPMRNDKDDNSSKSLNGIAR